MKQASGKRAARWGAALLGVTLVSLAAGSGASGRQGSRQLEHYAIWALVYPDSSSGQNVYQGASGQGCQLCHWDELGDNGWNEYGWRIRRAMYFGGTFLEALHAAERLDSDADPTGSLNIEEINGNAQPGWTPGPVNTIYFWDGTTLPNQVPPPAILGLMDPCLSHTQSSETVRLGSPPNPNALRPGVTTPPIVGDSWDPRVNGFLPGALIDFIGVDMRGPVNVPTQWGTLLILPPPDDQLFFKAPAGTPFSIPVPPDCSFVGQSAWAMGGSAAAGPTIAFCNGLDLVIGSY